MPRPRSVPPESASLDAPKKRAPRKRAVSVSEDGSVPAPKPRAPRKRVVKEEVTLIEETLEVADEPVARRAPTPLAAERQSKTKSRRSLIGALVVLVLFCGAGIAIGMSDRGQIDVVAVVNERNERINRGEVRDGESTLRVPVQNVDTRPNGGLVPATTVPETQSPVAATTTADTATTTAGGDTAATTTTDVPAADTTEVVSEDASTEAAPAGE